MNAKIKRITIFYVPALSVAPEVYETEGRAGYHIHSDENGVLGYRIYADNLTVLVPAANILKIETDL